MKIIYTFFFSFFLFSFFGIFDLVMTLFRLRPRLCRRRFQYCAMLFVFSWTFQKHFHFERCVRESTRSRFFDGLKWKQFYERQEERKKKKMEIAIKVSGGESILSFFTKCVSLCVQSTNTNTLIRDRERERKKREKIDKEHGKPYRGAANNNTIIYT